MSDTQATQPSSEPRNVIVIGSGPAGYTAAIYAARAQLSPLVFEGSVTAGGALMTTTEVENFPGFREGIQGPELMEEMKAQAERFGAELVADDVVEVDLTGDVKIVKTATDTYTARSVILATGSGYRKLGLPTTRKPLLDAVFRTARPATASSSASSTSRSSAAATRPSRRPPSSPASAARSR